MMSCSGHIIIWKVAGYHHQQKHFPGYHEGGGLQNLTPIITIRLEGISYWCVVMLYRQNTLFGFLLLVLDTQCNAQSP